MNSSYVFSERHFIGGGRWISLEQDEIHTNQAKIITTSCEKVMVRVAIMQPTL